MNIILTRQQRIMLLFFAACGLAISVLLVAIVYIISGW